MEKKLVQNIRLICAEMVQKANSGHPGAPMGLALFMHILYTEYLIIDPDNPKNPDRDIIVLSNGHACAIQYVMNYFVGYLEINDLKNFRKLNSKTPGHPEKNDFGIEITTGPLGQGVAASVGFAISASNSFNSQTSHIYCVFGDGCYQEGIAQEAFSLCSSLQLKNITFIYDFNGITIDGPTSLSMNEDVEKRFICLGFTVIKVDGDNPDSIREALSIKCESTKLILLTTIIGKDSIFEGDCKAHGSPLGIEGIKKLRKKYNLENDEFIIIDDLKDCYENAKTRMKLSIEKRKTAKNSTFNNIFSYENIYVSKEDSTRKHFNDALNSLKSNKPVITGSADLKPCVLTDIKETNNQKYIDSKYIHFGIREHAMCAVMNGLAAHGNYIPICGTFLNFISYGLPSVRLACLDNLKTIYVLTHDSILLGQDGPTHQPIEVLVTLRAIPNLVVLRPCDGSETWDALLFAMKENGPVAIILTRQVVPEIIYKHNIMPNMIEKGAYYICKVKSANIVILATGSEVSLALNVLEYVKTKGLKCSIVSFISFELFERQPETYKQDIIDKSAFIVSIEALSTFWWSKYSDLQIGLDEFGRSGPGEDVYQYLGFTQKNIGDKILNAFYKFNRNMRQC